MPKRTIILALSAIIVIGCATDNGSIDYKKINRQAASEYLQPIRNGYKGRLPFWNEYSDKFIYAPAFDFKEAEGAVSYRFTLKYIDDVARPKSYIRHGESAPTLEDNLAGLPDMSEGRKCTFVADSPKADLSPIWADVPPGNVALLVEALDAEGKCMEKVGARCFLRDFPFCGPYPDAARPYREALIMGLLYDHNLPCTRYWLDRNEPDPSAKHSSYVCKTFGAMLQIESTLARMVPSMREECLTIARKVADFMMSVAEPEDAPLAHFPPTYYKDYIGIAVRFQGMSMMMEATLAAEGYLDLYDVTSEQKYLDEAVAISDTYCRLQAEDGSFPIKVITATAESLGGKACSAQLLLFWQRLKHQYGIQGLDEYIAKSEKWMMEVAVPGFDLTGQFEDVSILGLKPFQNLTNFNYSYFARYLYEYGDGSGETIAMADELLAIAEDQFVHWDFLYDKNGYKSSTSPAVYEQYQYKMAIIGSAANVGLAFLAKYKATGDKLALAKAKAISDAATRAQVAHTGMVSTYWDFVPQAKAEKEIWINSGYRQMLVWQLLDEVL